MVLRKAEGFGRGEGLEALERLDLSKIDSFDALLRAMSKTAFGGRALGEAADVLTAMVEDSTCFVVLTLSGAMTIAKMGLVATEMIDQGWIGAVVSTGALLCHGFVESSGHTHFKYSPEMPDEELFRKGYDRVFDTIELENSLDEIESILRDVLRKEHDKRKEACDTTPLSSHEFVRALGKWLFEHTPKHERSMIKSCYRKNIPVFIPAFTDSELALDFDIYNRLNEPLSFDPFLDLRRYSELISAASTIGIVTIGGGVPRNWAQQVAPYLDILSLRLNDSSIPPMRFKYGVRICPDPPHWGGLSGCTYSEGVSWGKFLPPEEGGRFAEVFADATICWPILVKAVMERTSKRPKE